jgi:hypothetical protein
MYVDISLALKQVPHDKMCMAVSAAMAFGTTPEDFKQFMKDISVRYKNIRTEPGYGYIELKLYALAHNRDVRIVHAIPTPKDGPAILVVDSEHYKNVLHAIYLDEDGKLHDPNPDTNDGRDISSYKVKEYYKIVALMEK